MSQDKGSTSPRGGDFHACLGDPTHAGLLPLNERLKQIEKGHNPYQGGSPLAGNSPVFVGRELALQQSLSRLRKAPKPECVSLVAERRMGKSSFIEQLRTALAAEPGLLSVHACAQDWDGMDPPRFYAGLHRALMAGADEVLTDPAATDHAGLRDAVAELGRRRGLRCVLLLDELETLADNPAFDTAFFTHLRALADGADYPFAILAASRRSLRELRRIHKIEESAFWTVLLLFCGTFALQRLGSDYDSILFNTAHTYRVSYLTRSESAEVLQRPAKGILDYDPAALEQAFALTRGQPLVLQSIGATLIKRYDAALFNGEERSDYVSTFDLEQAVRAHIEQDDNLAFHNHWKDSDRATRKVLSALAWATTIPPLAGLALAAGANPEHGVKGAGTCRAGWDQLALVQESKGYDQSPVSDGLFPDLLWSVRHESTRQPEHASSSGIARNARDDRPGHLRCGRV